MTTRSLHLASALAVAALVVSACSGATSQPASADGVDLAPLNLQAPAQQQVRDLYKAAVEKNQALTVYGPSADKYKPVFEAFRKRFPGVKVTAQSLSGAELESKLAQEFSSGKHIGDVLETSTLNYLAKDYYESYRPASVPADFNARFKGGTSGQLWAPAGYGFGIQYNTSKLPADQAPKTWSDLADPKWKGRVTSGDPGQPSATSDVLIKLQAAGVVDDTYIRALKSNQLAIKGQLELADQAVARGEYDVLFCTPQTFFAATKAKGAPVKFVWPTQGTIYLPDFFGVVKGTSRPEGAKLFMNWLFSKEAQEAFATTATVPHTQGVKSSDGTTIDSLKILDVPSEQEMVKLFTTGTKKLAEMLGGAAK